MDPIEPEFEPLAAAIGRAVLGAAAVEKILLVDLAQRYGGSGVDKSELEAHLARLEAQPAGVLLSSLRRLGISEDLAGRIGAFIARRNRLVHRFMEDPEVLRFLGSSKPIPELVDRVDELSSEAEQLINEIAPLAFAGAEKLLGVTLVELAEAAQTMDLDSIEDDELRMTLGRLAQIGPDPFRGD